MTRLGLRLRHLLHLVILGAPNKVSMDNMVLLTLARVCWLFPLLAKLGIVLSDTKGVPLLLCQLLGFTVHW